MYNTSLHPTFPINHNHSDVSSQQRRPEAAWVLLLLLAILVLAPRLAAAQGFQGDSQACAADAPCFNANYQAGNTVIFQYTATCCWDFFNVRYAQAGGGDKQVETTSGTYTFTDVKPNRIYTLSVQGCNSHTLGHSTCTSWTQASVTTKPETGSVSSRVVTPAPPPKIIGRSNGGPQVQPKSTRPVPICETARAARARNSQVAPLLEARCRAQGGDPSEPPKVVGRVNGGPQATPPPPVPAPPPPSPLPQAPPPIVLEPSHMGPLTRPQPSGRVPVCDMARMARARNARTAPELEAQCRAQGQDSSPQAAPASQAPTDMLLTTMRALEPEGLQREGFDQGVAIGADQTAWGPGKQAMIDSLPEAEKQSAERSAHFVVARNANAKFDADGVRIAEQETRPESIAARTAEPAWYYTLGFDISAGMFASVVRGGAGHTLPGPGSTSIRDSLPPPGVRGFDAAMNLYMGK